MKVLLASFSSKLGFYRGKSSMHHHMLDLTEGQKSETDQN